MALPLVSERVLSNGQAGYPYHRERTRNHNTYSDEDKARAIVVLQVMPDQRAASRLLHIPQQTLCDWANGRWVSEKVRGMAKHFAEELSKAFEDILRVGMAKTLDSVKNDAMAPRDLNWLMINGADKWLVLNNMANSIVADATLTADEKRAKLQQIRDSVAAKTEGDGA